MRGSWCSTPWRPTAQRPCAPAQLHAFVVPDPVPGVDPDRSAMSVVFQVVATGLLDTIDRDAPAFGEILRSLVLTSATATPGS